MIIVLILKLIIYQLYNFMKDTKINIDGMKLDYNELNAQIETFLKLQEANRVGTSYVNLMEKIIERRDMLKQMLTDMGEL